MGSIIIAENTNELLILSVFIAVVVKAINTYCSSENVIRGGEVVVIEELLLIATKALTQPIMPIEDRLFDRG